MDEITRLLANAGTTNGLPAAMHGLRFVSRTVADIREVLGILDESEIHRLTQAQWRLSNHLPEPRCQIITSPGDFIQGPPDPPMLLIDENWPG